MTDAIIQNLRNVFTAYTNSHGVPINSQPLNRSDIFSKYFVVKSENGVFEIPMFAKSIIENKLAVESHGNIETVHKVQIVIPLYCNSEVLKRRVFNSIITYLFRYTFYKERMVCIKKVNSDTTIYGNRGILLDKDFNIMFLCTAECRTNASSFIYTGLKVYVNPSVFQNQNDFLNKHIIKTLIPFYLNTTICRVTSNYMFYESNNPYNVKVVIEDPNKFVYNSTIVKPSSFSNDDANDVVLRNINTVLDE